MGYPARRHKRWFCRVQAVIATLLVAITTFCVLYNRLFWGKSGGSLGRQLRVHCSGGTNKRGLFTFRRPHKAKVEYHETSLGDLAMAGGEANGYRVPPRRDGSLPSPAIPAIVSWSSRPCHCRSASFFLSNPALVRSKLYTAVLLFLRSCQPTLPPCPPHSLQFALVFLTWTGSS